MLWRTVSRVFVFCGLIRIDSCFAQQPTPNSKVDDLYSNGFPEFPKWKFGQRLEDLGPGYKWDTTQKAGEYPRSDVHLVGFNLRANAPSSLKSQGCISPSSVIFLFFESNKLFRISLRFFNDGCRDHSTWLNYFAGPVHAPISLLTGAGPTYSDVMKFFDTRGNSSELEGASTKTQTAGPNITEQTIIDVATAQSASFYSATQWSTWVLTSSTFPQQAVPRRSTLATLYNWINEKTERPIFAALVTLIGVLSVYLTSVGALLLLALYGRVTFTRKPRLLSPQWLITKATRVLLIAPGLARPMLFLGYKRRLTALDEICWASKRYFGLPARVNSEVLPYDAAGERLDGRICAELGEQKPVLIVGKGGAGKSTLLAHWAGLALSRTVPETLRDFIPIYVPPYYYRKDPIQAITSVLSERHGVNVTPEIVNTQMQSAQFLILLDGLSEVEPGDKAIALNDTLRVARSAEYRTCRFLIATRPIEVVPADVCLVELQPLTKDVLFSLIPRYNLMVAAEARLTRQLQLFGNRPLEPLLFKMAIDASGTEQISATRTDLYERYFQRLLQTKPNDPLTWKGWRDALEHIAEWSLLETGKRGLGLRHQDLVNRISKEMEDDGLRENLVKRLNRLCRLPLNSELELLDKLSSAGLLTSERRWRFSHDTFEEFFAASRLVSLVDQNNQWPVLKEWQTRETEFFDVIEFLAEMVEPRILESLSNSDCPLLWREHLHQTATKPPKDC